MAVANLPASKNGAAAKVPKPQPEVRQAVRDLLTKSKSFAQLPPATQQQIASDTAQISDYLVNPEGIPAYKLPTAQRMAGARALEDDPNKDDPSKSTYDRDVKQVNKVGEEFKAVAAREGAEVAGALLQRVNFPTFVSSLIQGVFHAIVQASIEQMEAYGKLVASVAQSLNQFRDQNVSENQGRDHLVDQFPDLFEIGMGQDDMFGGGAGPRVKLKDGIDEDRALQRVNSGIPMEGGPLSSLDLDDPETESKLVQGARTQLATSRQQLLATMVLMGINRIVVTDGKIQAKIIYDFQARDNTRRTRSAAAFDFARDKWGNVQKTYGTEGTYESNYEGGETKGKEDSDSYEHRDANWYAKGNYKYTEQPIMTAMSAASEQSESALQTKAQLSGVVDVNFKSDYFPLEKMADSFQIAQIQNAAKPVSKQPPPGGAATESSPPPPAGSQPPAATSPAAPAK